MTLGEKLKAARLGAGLSQRQLCEDRITRNMLSQIENGNASPSMETLRYLAGRLEKPVSYFLEEEATHSPNEKRMTQARDGVKRRDYAGALHILADFREPDPIFAVERELVEMLALLGAAERAIEEGRSRYAQELLSRAEEKETLWTVGFRRQRMLLQARAGGNPAEICAGLPSLDEELILRAKGALAVGNPEKAAALLDGADDQDAPQWSFLRGEVFLKQERYGEAAAQYHRAETAMPEETAPKLELCYREMGNYQQAYFYACKQKKQE